MTESSWTVQTVEKQEVKAALMSGDVWQVKAVEVPVKALKIPVRM